MFQEVYDIARQAVEYLRDNRLRPRFVAHADEVLKDKRKTKAGRLERMMLILDDIKHAITYAKGDGWYWYDQAETDTNAWNGPHDTFLAALVDVTDPYMESCTANSSERE